MAEIKDVLEEIRDQGGTGASAGQVQGTAADGAAAMGNPVVVGGVDSSGNAQRLAVASSGVPALVSNAVSSDGVNAYFGMLVGAGAGSDVVVGVLPLGFNGASLDRVRVPKVYKSVVFDGTLADIWAPAAGKKVRVMGFALSVEVACQLQLLAGPTVIGEWFAAANGLVNVDLGNGYLFSASDVALRCSTAGVAEVRGMVWGTEE